MTPDTISQTVLFPDLFDKPLVATFDEQHASSDGGGILLKAAERVYGLVKAFAGCLTDKRAPEKIRHTLADVIGQRIFGIACGHPDGNDADHLADDPIHKLLLGRDPVTGARLASQPTISRFENDVRRSALYRMGRELAACVIERHRRRLHGRARRITIDLDPTDDRTHGAQQLTFFNGHYGAWCYLPQLAFLTFDREVEQYLCAAVLRPGYSFTGWYEPKMSLETSDFRVAPRLFDRRQVRDGCVHRTGDGRSANVRNKAPAGHFRAHRAAGHEGQGVGTWRVTAVSRGNRARSEAAVGASPAYAGGGGSPKASGTTGSRARNISAISGGRSRPRWRAVRTTLDSTCWGAPGKLAEDGR